MASFDLDMSLLGDFSTPLTSPSAVSPAPGGLSVLTTEAALEMLVGAGGEVIDR